MPRKQKTIWFDEVAVRHAWHNARSMTEVINNLGEPLGSASYRHCKRAAERFNLSLPDGSLNKNTSAMKIKNTRPLSEILVERSTYSNRQNLKKRLIKAVENLRILCPNCHSQTNTFGYRPNR